MSPSEATNISLTARQVTMADIAREAGVSQATVSYVLNGLATEQRIPQTTVDRIQQISTRLNYRRDYLATAMSTRQTGVVGVVFTNAMGNFMDQMLRGIYAALRERGLQIALHLCDDDPAIEAEALDALRFRHADGVVAFPVWRSAKVFEWNEFLQTGKPVVFVDSRPSGIVGSGYVRVDDELIGLEAAWLFHSHGVRRPTLVGRRQPGIPHTIRLRQEGFRKGVEQAGLCDMAFIDADDAAAVQAALSGSSPTDGLFAAKTSDLTMAVKSLIGHGGRLDPGVTIASCGVDGEPFMVGNVWWMAEQPVTAMGRAAGAMITRAIEKGMSVGKTEVLSFQWRLNRLEGSCRVSEAAGHLLMGCGRPEDRGNWA